MLYFGASCLAVNVCCFIAIFFTVPYCDIVYKRGDIVEISNAVPVSINVISIIDSTQMVRFGWKSNEAEFYSDFYFMFIVFRFLDVLLSVMPHCVSGGWITVSLNGIAFIYRMVGVIYRMKKNGGCLMMTMIKLVVYYVFFFWIECNKLQRCEINLDLLNGFLVLLLYLFE